MEQASIFWDEFMPAVTRGFAGIAASLVVILVSVSIRKFLKSRGVPVDDSDNASDDAGSGNRAKLYDFGRRYETKEEGEVIIDGKPHKIVKTSKTVVGGMAGFTISNGNSKGKQTIEGAVGSISMDDGTTEIKGAASEIKSR